MHELFCLHVGQCGLQVGFALWELLAAEHNINRDGKSNSGSNEDTDNYQTFFNLSKSGLFVPKGLFVDLEPSVIDQMKTGSFASLYHPDQLVSGGEDAANNFARGFHTVGRIVRYSCENRIRREFEQANRIQGIHIYRSLGGGTGSGMTATLFEILIEYAKIAKVEIPIHPSPHLSSAVVEPYNSILSEHFCMDDVDISFLIDNEALYDIAFDHLGFKEVTFHNINRLVAQVCSSVTASARYENELCNDFTSLTNLVPYPRIHFPLVSYAPFGSESKISRNVNSVSEMTYELFHVANQLVKCDPESGKNMACSIVYRGNISATDIFSTLSDIKSSRHVRFVDWCPTGFKVGIVNQPPQVLPDSRLGATDKSAVMMTNNSAVSSIWHRLAQQFHRLYAKRSFIHWYVAEGLEESEFCESLYNLATLAKDYEEVALDTKIEDRKLDSPQVGEGEGGVKGEGDEGEGAAVAKNVSKSTEASKQTEEEDDDEENDNASNVSEFKKHLSNNNKSINWCNQFETLIKSLYESEDLSTSKLKSNLLQDDIVHSQCNEYCIERNKSKLKSLIETYNMSHNDCYVDSDILTSPNGKIQNQNNVYCNSSTSNTISTNQPSLYIADTRYQKDCQENIRFCPSPLALVAKSNFVHGAETVNDGFDGCDTVGDELDMMDQLVRLTSLL